jgi:hypothetical protein
MSIAPEPDTKDWTWVLRERCAECGFDSREPGRGELAALITEVGHRWVDDFSRIANPDARPEPAVWSPLEYACHVRDVLVLAEYRVRLMLEEDEPHFANWDQDATAIADDYGSQDPVAVSQEIGVAAAGFASIVATVPDDAWGRPGVRGDGAEFTVESFTRYLLHDPIHHLTDVTGRHWQ